MLDLGTGQVADLAVPLDRDELIAYGPALSDNGATRLETAALVRRPDPDPDTARAIPTPDRYADSGCTTGRVLRMYGTAGSVRAQNVHRQRQSIPATYFHADHRGLLASCPILRVPDRPAARPEATGRGSYGARHAGTACRAPTARNACPAYATRTDETAAQACTTCGQPTKCAAC
ncbi:hypothetical protein M2158_005379 [Streptomyces sp. SAI-144]|nr:hypothetical protein [Streptomyces sp. SAI-144]